MAKSSKPREGESKKAEWPTSPGSDERGGKDRKTRPGAAQRYPRTTWESSLNTQPRCRLEAARVTIHPVNDWSSQRWRRLPWQSRSRGGGPFTCQHHQTVEGTLLPLQSADMERGALASAACGFGTCPGGGSVAMSIPQADCGA